MNDTKFSRTIELLQRNMSTELITALNDPRTVEVMLNPDGSLWVEKLGQPSEKVGYYEKTKAMAFMETVPDMIAGIVSGKFDFTSGPAASAVAGAMAGGLAGTATSLAVGGAAAGHATASAARGASKTIDYMANHSVSDGMKDLGKAISQSSPAQAGKAALSAGAKNLGQIAKAGSNVSKAGAKAGASLAKGATQGTVRGMSATAGFAKESLSHPIKTGSAAKSALKNTGISAGKAALSEGKNAVQSMASSASEMGKSAKSALNSASAGIKSAVNQNITQPYQAGAKAAQSFQAGTQATEQNTDSQHDKGK